jgi:hypothetical protein
MLPAREPPVPIEQKGAWDPVPVWTLWIREKLDDLLEVQPVAKIRQYNKVLKPVVLNSPTGLRKKRQST